MGKSALMLLSSARTFEGWSSQPINTYSTSMSKTINIEKLTKDMERWPKAWAGFPKDIPVGKKIIETMHPFVVAMVNDGLASTTINRHLNNLWLLGGEIIRRVYMDEKERKLSGRELILRCIDDEGGPLCQHLPTEEEAKQFDATCKKFYRFLNQKLE